MNVPPLAASEVLVYLVYLSQENSDTVNAHLNV